MSVQRQNRGWRRTWQDLGADGMWGLTENQKSGMTPKFLAWASGRLEGATHHENENKRKARCRASFTRMKSTVLSSEVRMSHWPTSGTRRKMPIKRCHGYPRASVTHSWLMPFFSVLRVYNNMPGAYYYYYKTTEVFLVGYIYVFKDKKENAYYNKYEYVRSGVWTLNGVLGQNQSLWMNRWLCDGHLHSQPRTTSIDT